MFDDALTDRIYEAAVVPELWPKVLAEMSQAVGGAGGVLFTTNVDRMRWTTSPDIHELFLEFLRDGWAAINPRPGRLGAANYAGFVRDNEFFTEEEMQNDPVYRDFLRKKGLGWATGTMFDTPSGDSIIFSFERAHANGPVPLHVVKSFDRLRPHLARGALLSARLGLERATAMTGALEALGLPSAVLRPHGALLSANQSFEALMPVFAKDFSERLKLNDATADDLFADALSRNKMFSPAVNSIPIAATDERLPLILHLVPIRGAAHDVFSQAASLLVVTPVDRKAVPQAKVLQGLFDLTPAEARVAQAIGEAQSVENLATASGVSLETIRSQLKSVLAKTGLSRQQELVHLLAGKALPLNNPPE